MKWYSFRKRKIPVIAPILYYFTPQNEKTIGTSLWWIHIIEGKWQHELIFNSHYKKAGQFLFSKLKKDKNFLKKRLIQTEQVAQEWLGFCRRNLSNLKSQKDQKLIELLEKYYKFYEKFSLANVITWLYMPDRISERLIKELLHFEKEDITNISAVLTTPNVMSCTQEEALLNLSLVIEAKQKGTVNFEKLPKFKNLVQKYFWLPFDYLGPDIWDEKEYQKKIKKLLRQDIDTLKKQKGEIIAHQKDLKKKQKQLIAKLGLSQGLINVLEALKDLTTLQDRKKAITSESHFYLQNLFKELAQRTKMYYFDFYFLTKEETGKSLLQSKKFHQLARERMKLSITVLNNQKLKILTGALAKKYAKDNDFVLPSQEGQQKIKQIKGQVGSPGQARGKVCLMDSAGQISKIKKGEILVATMTTPDYVPAMKKAAAIVTDEGGITCHAAIVSREMKKPCIIGTKIATKVLKDGMLVRVDANKGRVVILKKK